MEKQQTNKMLNHIIQSLLAIVLSYLFYEVATFGKDIAALRATQFGNSEGLKVWQAIADIKQSLTQVDARGSEAFRDYVKCAREDQQKAEKRFEDHLLRIDEKITGLVDMLTKHMLEGAKPK